MGGRHGLAPRGGRGRRLVVGAGLAVGLLVAGGGCGGTADEPVVPSIALIESGLARSVNAANPVETACVEREAVGEYSCVMGPFRLDTSVFCDEALCTWEFTPPATPSSPRRPVTGSFRLG